MPDLKLPELKLAPRSPLQGLAVPGRLGHSKGNAGVTICEIHNIQIAHIIARNGRLTEVAEALSKLTGTEVPQRPARVGTAANAATSIAPGQWLVTRRSSAGPFLHHELSAHLANIAAVIDQTDGRVVLDVSGPRARDALAKGVPIDLDPTVFKPGSATQTAASHINLQIALIDDAPTFEIITAASTAASFWSWLTASAAEYGIDVATSDANARLR